MSRYLIRRLVLLVPTLIGVSLVVFILVRLLPGDAVAMQLQDAKSTAARAGQTVGGMKGRGGGR